MIEFKKWPKTPRWYDEEWSITEKIDGSNACVVIDEFGAIGAQSRNNLITPDKDNLGFAQWVQDNKVQLLQLGPGHHYGEWWGKGIQRTYGLDERRFSLFRHKGVIPDCCYRVPSFEASSVAEAYEDLVNNGSKAVPGWMKPEGVVMRSKFYSKMFYKILIDK